MIEIEEASSIDTPDIERLYIQLFDVIAELQPYHFKPAQQDFNFIESMIADDDSVVLVARKGEEIVGFLVAKEQRSPPYNCCIPRKIVYIMDLIVDVNCRGKGIGKLLMNEVENWTTSRNLEYLELSVLSENSTAIGLYQELGFTNTIHTMGKILK